MAQIKYLQLNKLVTVQVVTFSFGQTFYISTKLNNKNMKVCRYVQEFLVNVDFLFFISG